MKMDEFCWKAPLVAGGHITDVPPTVIYPSVVWRETVCIALTMAALNALKVLATEIMNSYITTPIIMRKYGRYLVLSLVRTKAVKP